jgi:hypothetical protein
MRGSCRSHVAVPPAMRPRIRSDREPQLALGNDPPLTTVAVFGHGRVLSSLKEDGTRPRPPEETDVHAG